MFNLMSNFSGSHHPLQGRGIDVAPRAGTCLQVRGVVSNGLIVYNCLKDSGKGIIS